jgi:hypothetical protein
VILLASGKSRVGWAKKTYKIKPDIIFNYVNSKNDAENLRALKPGSAKPADH